MRAVASVATDGLRGLEGDRYALGRGHWSGTGYRCEPVTLVAVEDLEEVSRILGRSVEPRSVRRNIVTRGVAPASLLGRTFRIGDVLLEGTRPCEPCRYLERLAASPGLAEALRGRGGVRAVLRGPGLLSVGDPLRRGVATRNVVDTGSTGP